MAENKKTYGKSVQSLKDKECFVFGSNLAGFHGAGSAGFASFGKPGNIWREEGYAEKPNGWKGMWNVKGVGVGFQEGREGCSYALPTVERAGAKCSLTTEDILLNVNDLYSFARSRKDWTFFVAGDNDGKAPLNGYSHKEIARTYFEARPIPPNVIFSDSYQKIIDGFLDEVAFATSNYKDRLKIPPFGYFGANPDFAPMYTKSDLLISKSYSRVVFGRRGPYIEFCPDEFEIASFHIPEKEAYRLNSDVVFYNEYRSNCKSNVKAYFQKKVVDYADYRVGMWYVSPFELKTIGLQDLVLPIENPISIFD